MGRRGWDRIGWPVVIVTATESGLGRGRGVLVELTQHRLRPDLLGQVGEEDRQGGVGEGREEDAQGRPGELVAGEGARQPW